MNGQPPSHWTPSVALQKARAELAPCGPLGQRALPMRILVVEDNPDDRIIITRQLKRHNCEVASVPDAAAGIAALDAERFDLCLVDIRLGPYKDGLDLINETRPRHPKVCYVAMSGFDNPIARGVAADIGIALVTKTALEEAVNYLLSHG